jgi:peroxiredoxin Q/BCP
MTPLCPGDPAPDFTAQAHNGQQVRLADYRGKHVVVLYFYPMDGSPVCTKEACSFRDAFEEFTKLGAVVIGVSADSPERHRTFAASRALPFLLLSDQDGSVRNAYQVPKTLGVLPGRVTYVIDKQGIVRYVFSALFSAEWHVAEALRIVRELAHDDPGPAAAQTSRRSRSSTRSKPPST